MNDYRAKAEALLDWNKCHLTSDAEFTKNSLAKLFADKFIVIANGRTYDANYDNYYAFLNEFRSTIKSISYTVHNYIAADNYVTLPMQAHIIRTNNSTQDYEAILILQFNDDDKIISWHEVYIEL